MTEEEKSWVRLHLTPGLGRAGLIRLLGAIGSLESVLAAPPRLWVERAGIRPAVAGALPAADDPRLRSALASLEQAGASVLTLWDGDRYPPLLAQIPDPPALLYLRGVLPVQEGLAVVGARHASPAGRRWTEGICAELAARGVPIVSGLARGIDAAAHQGALAGGGTTVAVLGCGIDRVYPPENARLFRRIEEQGAIISEYPPGTPPLAGHFPGRNRIVSGLCRGVLVVEAAEESGSLITADFALEQGREVFAVPGPVASPNSAGVHRLLKDGAHLATEARDILEVLWPSASRPRPRPEADPFAAGLSEKAGRIYRLLGDEPLHVDELCGKTGLTPMDVSVILLDLELRGGVEKLPGMRYLRRNG